MVKEDFDNYIFEYKIGLQTIKGIYESLYNRYFIEDKNNLNHSVVSPQEPIDRRDESIKIRYMVIAIMCSNLEGFLANIRSIEGDREKRKFLNKEFLFDNNDLLKQIFLIRDCIMHSNGIISKSKSRNDRGKVLTIDSDYTRNDKIILLESDILDFFFLLENKILDIIQSVIKK